ASQMGAECSERSNQARLNSYRALDGSRPPRRLGHSSVPRLSGFRIGEGAIRRPEPQSVRQRFLALADLWAGVEIEKTSGLQQRSGSRPQGTFHGRRRDALVDDQSNVLLGHWETRDLR